MVRMSNASGQGDRRHPVFILDSAKEFFSDQSGQRAADTLREPASANRLVEPRISHKIGNKPA
jgi:hypothetical protein